MDRLFLDANVLFSAAYKGGGRVVQLWRLKDCVLCSSLYALEEVKFNLSDEDDQRRLEKLSGGIEFFEAPDRDLPRGVSLPEKDVPILLAAIESRADYLLTGDFKHFGGYFGRKVGGVVIASPSQYLKIRERDRR